MSSTFITAKDDAQIFYKDWGSKTAQPVVFHHGWPLSADDWDSQMMFFLLQGYRVIAHDRRGHGRSTQTDTGNNYEAYASDVVTLTEHLDLKSAIHVGHSAGGGEVARYVALAKPGRVAKAVLVSSVAPVMLKSPTNPGGLPMEVFDGLSGGVATQRAEFFRDVASGPFYGFNRQGAKPSPAIVDNWWRQGMMGGAKAQYDCIKSIAGTEFTEDLKKIDVPVLVLHGEDDQIVPIDNSARQAIKLLKYGTLKTYPSFPHGMPTTHADVINPDLLAFFKA
jgi:non-heme chloroperoxidase